MVSDPNLAITLVALGILLIYTEFCFIGKVIPCVLGGILLLVGLASLTNAPAGTQISWTLAATLAIAILAISAYLLRIATRARRNKRRG